ncbi:MAG: threonine synthase, partial [Betaproteobacteria bacterium]
MRYVSTRGRAPEQGFLGILLSGLATDGGLSMPTHYPRISDEDLTRWRTLDYATLAFEVLQRFADDIPADDLRALCERTYTVQVYGNGRPDSDLRQITPPRWIEPGLGLLEVSNGPTLAFKDMAMQLIGALFEYALAREGAELNVLGATSGDTGSAAEYAMRGRRGIRVFMLSPQGRMSAFQRAQMYSLDDANIFNIAVDGTFDDCQDIVKQVSADLDFKRQMKIGTVNSINWARVVAQVVYYVKGYLAATTSNAQKVSFCVPSGNFGNVFAGWVARKMGLPIERLIVATNINDILHRALSSGDYSAGGVTPTITPSMDIQVSSNFERLLVDAGGRDGAALAEQMRAFEASKAMQLSNAQAEGAAALFTSARADQTETARAMQWAYRSAGQVIDPHTGVGLHAARALAADGTIAAQVPLVTLATAHP